MNIYPDWLLSGSGSGVSVQLMEGLAVEADGIYEVESVNIVDVEAAAEAVVATPPVLETIAVETPAVETESTEVST